MVSIGAELYTTASNAALLDQKTQRRLVIKCPPNGKFAVGSK